MFKTVLPYVFAKKKDNIIPLLNGESHLSLSTKKLSYQNYLIFVLFLDASEIYRKP
jgi:hypothetical protein